MEFKITVSKRIAQTTSTESLICGNDGDTLTVTFDDEWANFSAKTARLVWIKSGEYTYIDVPFTGTSCPLPAVIQAKMLFVGFFAGDSTENTLKTSTPAQIPCISSILDVSAEASIPDVYRNILDIIANKVDKVEGKGLSTNDYTNEDKAEIAKIANKVDKVPGKDLSTNDFTTELKDKLDGMEEGANKTTVDAELSATSENPVQNKIVKAALDKKIEEPTTNGLVWKFMSGMYGTAGVNTTMPDSPTHGNVPTTKLLKDYVEDNTSNPLKLSDTNLKKSGLIAQSYTPAGSTPGTVGTRTYSVIERDVLTLDDTISGASKVPSSYVVGNYVKESISAEQSRTDNTFSNALKGSKSGGAFLIDDVSPVTREMGVKISSDTIEDLTAVKVRKQGKNLIPFPYQELTLGTSTYNGVDFTVYEDGSILINGTATSSTARYLYRNLTDLLGLKSGTTISGSKNASDDTQQGNVYFLCNYYNSTGTMTQGLVASTTPSGTKTITDEWKGLGIYINVPNGKTLNNLLIKPQLEIGATATEYEPYITPTEYIPTADGTVNGITSLYPNTTLTTDTEGVIINCKYNRDINKAFAALEAAAQNFLINTEAGS